MTKVITFVGLSGAKWHWRPDQPLGEPGGFGGVYAGEGFGGEPMAIKVVYKRGRFGRLDDRLLRREIVIGGRVVESGSKMLLPVIDAAETDDAMLLVMMRAEGALSNAPCPVDEMRTISVITEIALGLQELHGIGIIHRDLKPHNVLWHEKKWKLADFGIARDQEIGTQDPTFKGWGSWSYMAPELWDLRSPTPKTDLYALGCVAYELLVGSTPYTGSEDTIRHGHCFNELPEFPCDNVVLRNLIIRLLAKDPGDRPQDARAVLARLQRAALMRSRSLEEIGQGLAIHATERFSHTVQQLAAKETAERNRQLRLQARNDLLEIMSDALEELQSVEPETTLKAQNVQTTGPGNSINRADFVLGTSDAAITICLWPPEILLYKDCLDDQFHHSRRHSSNK